jgi:hypothetical protein
MRALRCSVTILALAGSLGTTLAQPAKLPDAVTCHRAIADIATCYSAKIDTGAYLLAAMPKNWNGNLIVFAHGGRVPFSRARITACKASADMAWK